jgi:alpha-D-xyloside xylohydrolase
MALEFQDDPSTYALDLQYMFGKELLVAPIYNSRGERTIYLPEGRWINFWTHEILEGSRTIRVQVPLDIMPLYVHANALIPTIEPLQFTANAPFEEITFDAYLLEQGAFELRDSDGVTYISATLAGNQLRIVTRGAKSSLGLRLLPLTGKRIEAVYVNGRELSKKESAQEDALLQEGWISQQDGTTLVALCQA